MNLTAIIIVAIVCGAIVSLSKNRTPNKKNNAKQSQLAAEHEKMRQDISMMAERLAILEKIVTDEKYHLNKEFDSLKD